MSDRNWPSEMEAYEKKAKLEKRKKLPAMPPIVLSNPIGKDRPAYYDTFEVNVTLIYKELQNLLLQKHKDYGPRNIADAPGGALNGLRVRMHDKLARINNLYSKSSAPANESLEDSFKDLANYAIIGLLVLRGKWDTK